MELMVKKRILLIIKSAVFIVLLAGVILVAAKTVSRKESSEKYSDFFECADQIDVLFMGSSHVINGINPVKLYENYGYTSYNMGGHGSVLPATYWELMEALEYSNPKVVVVDTYMLEKDYVHVDEMYETSTDAEREASIEQLHLNMDAWPLSKTKAAAINDLIGDEETRKEFLYPFTLYHNRWDELTMNDYGWMNGSEEDNELFGAEARFQVCLEPDIERPEDGSLVLSGESEGTKYLKKIIEECQDRGIDVVLTFLPVARYTEEDEESANTAEQIAKEYGVSFVNMEDEEDIVDYNTDMNDNGHLNNAGMEKVTDFIGEYLQSGFDNELTDHREDETYSKWDDQIELYHQQMTEAAYGQDDLFTELLALENTNDSFFIYVKDGSSAITNSDVGSLIKALSGTEVYNDALVSNGPYMLYKDGNSGLVTEFAGEAESDTFLTSLGDTEYIGIAGFAAIYEDGNEENDLLDMADHYTSDVQILIVDKDRGEIKYRLFYSQDADEYTIEG